MWFLVLDYETGWPLKSLANYLAKWPSGRPATLHRTLVRGASTSLLRRIKVHQVMYVVLNMRGHLGQVRSWVTRQTASEQCGQDG
jgi:hypothetical protein